MGGRRNDRVIYTLMLLGWCFAVAGIAVGVKMYGEDREVAGYILVLWFVVFASVIAFCSGFSFRGTRGEAGDRPVGGSGTSRTSDRVRSSS